MSERIYSGYSGPLDRVRAIENEAYQIDWAVAEHGVKREHRQEYTDYLNLLESIHPYIGREVVVYGEPLSWSIDIDSDITYSLILPGDGGRGHDDRINQTKGLYRGYAIKHVYDSLNDMQTQRLVHAVQTGQTKEINDYHNLVTTQFIDYFTFTESVVTPTIPVDIHSFEDLKKDGSMTQIDEAAFSEDDRYTTIQNIGIVASRIFGCSDWRDSSANERNRQRVSYINSLGLLNGVGVLTRDMVVTNIESAFHPDATNYYGLDGDLRINDSIFDIGPSYEKLSTGEFLPGGPSELYIKVEHSAEHAIYTPVRRLTGIIEA